jgi:hypothetical protein
LKQLEILEEERKKLPLQQHNWKNTYKIKVNKTLKDNYILGYDKDFSTIKNLLEPFMINKKGEIRIKDAEYLLSPEYDVDKETGNLF